VFKKQNRLLKNLDFQKVISNNKKIFDSKFIIFYKKNDFNFLRLGVTVEKKIKGICLKNKIKRQVKSICFHLLDLKEGYDILILVRKKYDFREFSLNFISFKGAFDFFQKNKF
jgi:ribonuclease P protein component